MAAFSFQNYEAPGPVCAEFIESVDPMNIIMGPAGSGKTVGSCVKGPRLAASWFPMCKDGTIRVKSTAIRDTYTALEKTLLQTWHEMFPKNHKFTKSYSGGQGRPITHVLEFGTIRDQRQVKVEFIMQFAAIGDNNVEQFIKGYETSFGYLNEVDLLQRRVPSLLYQRTGRYPPMDDLAPSELERIAGPRRKLLQSKGLTIENNEIVLPRVVFADFNPPDIDHWLYEDLIEKPNPLFTFFRQPGGLSVNAENRKGKSRSSYEEDLTMMNEQDAKRYVHAEFAYSGTDKPIYPEFNLNLHRSDDFLRVEPKLPIYLGLDLGGSPACEIKQFMPNGQLRILREICCTPGAGPETISRMVQEVLLQDFKDCTIGGAWIDPSGFYGADRQSGQLSAAAIVGQSLNLNIQPGPTQEPGLRFDAVRWYLKGLIDGHTPRMIVDPRCKMLIGGFAAHYKLTKQASEGATDILVATKNMYSHVHDALQYGVTGFRGVGAIVNDIANNGRAKNVVGIKSRSSRLNANFDVHNI